MGLTPKTIVVRTTLAIVIMVVNLLFLGSLHMFINILENLGEMYKNHRQVINLKSLKEQYNNA